MAVQNIFAVSEATLTELQILYRHNICKGQIHSWEYMCSDLHRLGVCSNNSYRYKSEAIKTLYRINLYTRVTNKILMDNSPKQTVYNT